MYSRHQKNYIDQSWNSLNDYHRNIKLTIEANPREFLETQIITKDGKIKTDIYRKSTKLPVP